MENIQKFTSGQEAMFTNLQSMVDSHLFEQVSYHQDKYFRVRTGPGNPGKAENFFFIKPWKISQNFIEKINS